MSTAKEISSNGFRAGRHGVCHVTGAGEIRRSAGPDVHRMHSEPLREFYIRRLPYVNKSRTTEQKNPAEAGWGHGNALRDGA